jgi:hypothetical protein
MKKPALLALAPVPVAVAIAGCGGSGSSAPSYGGAKGKPSSARVTGERAVARTPPQMLALTSFSAILALTSKRDGQAHRLRTENGD